jgi:hypothetical protein
MQSWQVLHYARKHLGRSILYSIFGKKNARAVDYWCEDPRFTAKDDGAYDPIHGVKALLEMLDDQGHCSTVRACVAYLIQGTSEGCGIEPAVVEMKPTVAEEVLADYRAVADMQDAIDAGESIEVVNDLKYAAVEELHRTVAKYIEDRSKVAG